MKESIKKNSELKKNDGLNQMVFDKETLKMWKYSSVRAKLDFLESALKFGKGKKW